MKLQLQVQAKKEELLYKVILQNRCFEFSGGNLNIETPTLSHPLKHAITTKFCVSSRHHAINLVQFTITPINVDLPLDFYDGTYRNLLKIPFSSTLHFETKSTLPSEISENSEVDLGSMPHLGCNSCVPGNC